jgi:hypothetical protein
MALPRENRTAKVIAVEEAIKKMSPQELAALPGLDGEDFKVFGTFIQHFCFIDLNLRRALELFAISKMPVFLPGERWGYRHNRPLDGLGRSPVFKRNKASRRLTTNSFFLRDGSLPGWAKTLLSRLRALLRLEPGPEGHAQRFTKA